MILVCGALLGLISVAFGAFAEHGLRSIVTDEQFRLLMTAVRYNQAHAVITSAIGLALHSARLANIPALKWSGLLFITGTVLFSFSIYLSVSFDIPYLMNITPVGGITIIAAWLLLLTAGLLVNKKQ